MDSRSVSKQSSSLPWLYSSCALEFTIKIWQAKLVSSSSWSRFSCKDHSSRRKDTFAELKICDVFSGNTIFCRPISQGPLVYIMLEKSVSLNLLTGKDCNMRCEVIKYGGCRLWDFLSFDADVDLAGPFGAPWMIGPNGRIRSFDKNQWNHSRTRYKVSIICFVGLPVIAMSKDI